MGRNDDEREDDLARREDAVAAREDALAKWMEAAGEILAANVIVMRQPMLGTALLLTEKTPST